MKQSPPSSAAARSEAGEAGATKAARRAAFFRQSGWMMLATIIGGMLMWSVHLLSRAIPASEYGTLITLFAVVNLIPTMPLQMVFTQQTALALATGHEARLAGLLRWTGVAILVTWTLGALAVEGWHGTIAGNWHLVNPAALPVLLAVILLSLAWPVFAGMLQGRQNFLWLGWGAIFNGAGRIGAAVVIVLVWHGQATGIMLAVVAGLLAACALGAWQTRSLWGAMASSFDHTILAGQVLPLMLGFGATQFLFCADTAFVNAYFGAERTAPYGAAGTLSRALLWLVLPLAGVLFPKIVHSHATAEKSGLLGVSLLITGTLAGLGFVGLWVLGPWLVLIFPPGYRQATLDVLPWYAGAMIPLALGNLLVNDLLARSRFRVVPALMLVAAGYGLALARWHTTPTMVLQLLGEFNLLLLAVCVWFAWRDKK
jgi:O-antigen/teichoic acid export membrane protein